MIDLTCPWCEEESAVDARTLQELETGFTCPRCGTSVTFVDAPSAPLELAA